MSLGQAKTNRFQIGTAELRVGPLTAAGRLTQDHSVGLIDSAAISHTRETAQLMGMFPKKLVDETPISESCAITATLREYSRKNMGILLGQGNLTAATDVTSDSVVAIGVTAAAPEITVASAAGFAANDVVSYYIVGSPEFVAVGVVASIALNVIKVSEMDAALFTKMNALVAAGATIRVFRAATVSVGNLTQTEYFAASLVQKDLKTGRPIVFNFWKVSATGGMEYATNADDYASTEMTLNVLEPSAADYDIGADLEHLAAIIPTCPMYMVVNSADVVS